MYYYLQENRMEYAKQEQDTISNEYYNFCLFLHCILHIRLFSRNLKCNFCIIIHKGMEHAELVLQASFFNDICLFVFLTLHSGY